MTDNSKAFEFNKQSVAKAFMWKIVERLLTQGINFAVQIILARLIAPEDFGELAIIITIIDFITLFVNAGLSTYAVQKKDLDSGDIKTLFTASLLVALVGYIILFFSAGFIADFYESEGLLFELRILGIILFLNAIYSIQNALLVRGMQFKRAFIFTLISISISGVVGVFLAIRGFGIWSLIIHNLLNIAVLVFIMEINKKTRIQFGFNAKKAKDIYAFTYKILLTGLVSGLYDSLRTLTIGKKYTKEELSYYDKGATYSKYIYQLANHTVSSVLLSTLSKLQDDRERLKMASRKAVYYGATVVFPVMVGFACVSKSFVSVFLTDVWAFAVPFLSVFCILRLMSFLISIERQIYFSIGKTIIDLFYEMSLLVLNLSALLIFINYGMIYVAISALAIECTGYIGLTIVTKKCINYSLRERIIDLWKPSFCTVVMALCVMSISMLSLSPLKMLIVQIVIGVLTYTILSFIFKNELFFEIIRFFRKKTMTTLGGNMLLKEQNDIISIACNKKWDENYIPPVSIVTSVYNRPLELERALTSVERQTNVSLFEYIIVNNGSTENLDIIVQRFMERVDFPVKYIKKEFGGPHEGRNRGKIFARGKYLITLDSDDELVENAVETLFSAWQSINNPNEYWEVVCLCKDQNNNIVGKEFPKKINSLSNKKALKECQKTRGEHFSMDLLKVHVDNLFPEPDGIMYITENIVWDKIRKKGYKSYYLNVPLRIYHTDTSDSITISRDKRKSIQSLNDNYWSYSYFLNNWYDYPYNLFVRIKFVMMFMTYSFVLKRKKSISNPTRLKGVVNNLIFAFLFLPCWIYSFSYEKKKCRI